MATRPTPDSGGAEWAGELSNWLTVFFRADGSPKFSMAEVSYDSGDDTYTVEASNNIVAFSDESFSNGRVDLEFIDEISSADSVFLATCEFSSGNTRMASISDKSTTGCRVNIHSGGGVNIDGSFCIFVLEN